MTPRPLKLLAVATDAEAVPSARERVWRAVAWFITESDIQTAEVVCTLVNIWWTVVLWWPGDLFATNPAFAGMAVVFRETHWATISAAVAIAPLAALVTGQLRFRRAALLLYGWYYLTITAAIAAVSVVNTGVGVYATLAAGAAWGYWRLGARARQ